jgi:hypothetical protein
MAAFDPDLSTIRARAEGAELVNIGGCGGIGGINNLNLNNIITTINSNTPINNNIIGVPGITTNTTEQHQQLFSTMFGSPPVSQTTLLQLYMTLRGNNSNNGNEQNFHGIYISIIMLTLSVSRINILIFLLIFLLVFGIIR